MHDTIYHLGHWYAFFLINTNSNFLFHGNNLTNNEKFDKDIFRYDKGNLVEAYEKLLVRLGIIK